MLSIICIIYYDWIITLRSRIQTNQADQHYTTMDNINLKFFQMSYVWNVLSMKWLMCEMFFFLMFYLWNVLCMKCPIYEMSFLWNVLSMKCSIYEMSYLWNFFLWNVLSIKCDNMQLLILNATFNTILSKFPEIE